MKNKMANRIDIKKIQCIACCLILVAAIFLAWYLSSPTLHNRYNSPLHIYRLEVYDASWFQKMMYRDFAEPSVVRLYQSNGQKLLGTSPVVDRWRNDAIVWNLDSPGSANDVQFGKDVRFDQLRSECEPPSPLLVCMKQ
ncbi:hypothetical protein [Acidovorax sp. PRC11]|uniref:hypothetical protein n=1 Tax=Acidovorax sp. PRC11 TaxID=2962592 RepID=UPI002881EDC9|nr:hypothetical protein [Acidovorax sp. PRC11]MDT0136740.1 hypothetical protein [Acidovorax sp. PRC11]